MKRLIAAAFLLFGTAGYHVAAHDFGSTPILWNREVSRIVYDRCASCHRPGGSAFSLMTYTEAQPRAGQIKDAVLSRRMPPWGAVKGFGSFRNDEGLTQEQLELITAWVEGGTPRGNNPNVLPKQPTFEAPTLFSTPQDGIVVSGEVTLSRSLTLDGVFPEHVPEGLGMQVVAALPDGRVAPLLWLYEYKNAYRHPFLLRKPLVLPRGTVIRGVPAEARVVLLPGA